jgi:quinol-cytochrome oxidoreductase complex cytochrome b subunit
LLLITLLLSFTGYLLPWDQLSIWAVTVGTNMAKYAPIAGPYTRYLLIGGRVVGDNALLRFYVLHVVGLPLAAFLLMVVHFWRVRKDGFSGGL